MFLIDWFKKFRTQESKISLTLKVIDKIDPSKFKDVFSSDNSISTLSVGKPTVQEYIVHLQKAIKSLETEQIFDLQSCNFNVQEIYKRDFFTVNKVFVDPCVEGHELLKLCKLFINLYLDKEREDNKSFNTQKNLMFLQNTVHNVLTLIEGLKQ